MKTYALILLATMLICAPAAAADAEGIKPASEQKADLDISITVRFPTLPDAPSFTAGGTGPVEYSLRGTGAIIKGESLPRLSFESNGPIGGMKELSVVVEAIPGTSPAVDWSRYPEITLQRLELRVRAYERDSDETDDHAKPVMDFVLPDLKFSTERIEVEGEEAKGYVDVDGPEVLLVGAVVLPKDGFPRADEWLSKEPAILELRVGLVNPYGR